MNERRAFACIAAASFLLFGAARAAAQPMRCEGVTFDVAQTPGGPVEESIAAQLCARGTVHDKTVQVLIHGATYDNQYWDFPYEPDTYSYARYMTDAGYAILSLDRVGSGQSSHPANGAEVTLHTAAFNVFQVVQRLRSGDLVVQSFGRILAERIELVGFSLGSFIAALAAAAPYGGVDGVVLSSYSHRVAPGAIASFGLVEPASVDPKFPGYPDTYLSLQPGARELLFFHLPNVDPAVLSLDFDLRQTWTVGELGDIVPTLLFDPPAMHVPVLIVDGDWDAISCDTPCTATAWLAGETSLYPADTCAELQIIPDAGHSLALHQNAQVFFSAVRDWSDRRVGASTKDAAPEPCP